MATVLRNAKLFIDGVELTGGLNDLSVDYSAEMLDATVFGSTTRIFKGGLVNGSVSGSGFFDNAIGTERVLFGEVGSDDAIVAVFPDGIEEGSLTTGVGFGMKAVVEKFDLGAKVGELLAIEFAFASRGVNA